jgi:hypothetical protein
LKEKDFKEYAIRFEEQKKELEQLKEIAKINFKLFKVSTNINDPKEEYTDLQRELLNAFKKKLIEYDEIIRISRIIWQQGRIKEAYELRKKLYENEKSLRSAIDYCSLSNYMTREETADEICNDRDLNNFMQTLTRYIKNDYATNDETVGRLWTVAGIRFLKAANKNNDYFYKGILCIIKGLESTMGSKMQRRRLFMSEILGLNIEKCIIEKDVINKLKKLKNPEEIIDKKEIEQYILQHICEYTETEIKSNEDILEIKKKYFERWKEEYNVSINFKKGGLNEVFIKFMDDFYKIEKKHTIR